MNAFIIFISIVSGYVIHESIWIGLFILGVILFIQFRYNPKYIRLMIPLSVTAISYIAVFNLPEISNATDADNVTIVGYKYYKDDIFYIVNIDGSDYEWYAHEKLEVGVQCIGDFSITLPKEERNFIKNNDIRRMQQNNIHGRIYDYNITQCFLVKKNIGMHLNDLRHSYISSVLSSTIADYKFDMLTLSIGIKSYIESEFFDALQKLGIYHLYVISGTHVAFITAVLFIIFKRFRLTIETIRLLLIIILFMFFLFNLFSPSVLRATLMAIMLLLLSYSRRRPYLSVISLTAIFQIIFYPHMMYHAGFQLSYVTTYFIILTRRYWLNRSPLYQLFTITLISEVSTLLLLLIHFNEISISGIIMNMFFGPLFSIVIFPSVIFFNILILTGMLHLFNDFYDLLFNLIQNLILFLSKAVQHRVPIVNLNDISIIFLSCLTITSIMHICKLNLKKLAFSFSSFVIIIALNQYLTYHDFKVTMIDVGQGDSFLIQDLRNRKAILIDTGGRFYVDTPVVRLSDKTVLPYLKHEGLKTLDLVILTHIDLDHVGEFDNIYDNIHVENVLVNKSDPAFNEFWTLDIDPLDVNHIESMRIGNILMYHIYPYKEHKHNNNNSNESSIVTLVVLNDFYILFTGDTTIEIEDELMDVYDLEIDVLKVAHHGSNTSTSKEFIRAINPKIALISSGVDNRYQHPHDDVLQNLAGLEIFRTNELGMIELFFTKNKLCARSKLKDFQKCYGKYQ